jgi:hypothetical protein
MKMCRNKYTLHLFLTIIFLATECQVQKVARS